MAINLKSGDKTAINPENGDKYGEKVATKFKKKIFEYFAEHKKLVPKGYYATPKT